MAETTALRVGLPPRWRTTAAIFAGLTALLVLWYAFFLRETYTILYRDMRPADAAAIVAELDRQHVHYQLRAGGTQILVPQSQSDTLRVHMAGAEVTPNGTAGFELFDDSDMGLTEFAQKIKYQRALQGELARTILMMDGVVAVRVHISTPERSLFRSEQRDAHAAVTLVTRSPSDETTARIEGIQRLVAAAVTDMAPSDVVVLNGRGEVLSSTIEHLYISPETIAAPATLLGGDADNAEEPFIAIIGRALPDRRFAVTISQAGSAAPGANTGRLIDISTEEQLAEADVERLTGLLHQSALLTDADTISYHNGLAPISTTEAPSAPVMQAQRRSHGVRPTPNPPSILIAALSALGAILVSAAALLLVASRNRRGTLDADAQRRFADHLRESLRAQEEEHEPA